MLTAFQEKYVHYYIMAVFVQVSFSASRQFYFPCCNDYLDLCELYNVFDNEKAIEINK